MSARSGTLAVRPMRPAERDRVRELHRTAFAPGAAFPDPVLDRLFRHERAVHLVAQLGERTVGYACALHGSGDRGEIATVHVDEPHRGRGIARALLAELETRLATRGVRTVALQVHAGNAPARRLYEATGYTLVGKEEDGYPVLTPRTALVFEKHLR